MEFTKSEIVLIIGLIVVAAVAIYFYHKYEKSIILHQTSQEQSVDYPDALDQENRELRHFKNNIKTFTTKTSPDKVKAFAKKRK